MDIYNENDDIDIDCDDHIDIDCEVDHHQCVLHDFMVIMKILSILYNQSLYVHDHSSSYPSTQILFIILSFYLSSYIIRS